MAQHKHRIRVLNDIVDLVHEHGVHHGRDHHDHQSELFESEPIGDRVSTCLCGRLRLGADGFRQVEITDWNQERECRTTSKPSPS